MPKYAEELPNYEILFPENQEIPIKKIPRRSQRIKSTGTPAKLESRIRTAQEYQVKFHIDLSTRFQFEKDRLLNILPFAKLQDHDNLVIPYQPTKLQLTRIYTILPIDIFVTAISCPNKTTKSNHRSQPKSQHHKFPDYLSEAPCSDYLETRDQDLKNHHPELPEKN